MPWNVVILGGGYAGLPAARALERRLPPQSAHVTLVSDTNFMLYTPLLPGASGGTLEPRHVVVPLREELHRTDIRLGRVVENALCPTAAGRTALAVYQSFVPLLEQHFADRHDVQYYADALHMSSANLSRQLQAILGKTTKQIIDERIVLEARRLLQYTPQSVGEIAYALGYSDQFHLSKTFKRLVGVAPQEYRDQRQKST